jgi:branched-chain amino acid transport system permease protein
MTMDTDARFDWGLTVRLGLLMGTVALSLCLIGMVGTFDERDIIGRVLTLGQIMLFGPAIGGGYLLTRSTSKRRSSAQLDDEPPAGRDRNATRLLGALLLGLISSLPVILLVFVGQISNPDGTLWVRQFLPNVSPQLLEMLTFGQEPVLGSLILAGVTAVLAMLGAGIYLLPSRVQRPLLAGLVSILAIGLLAEIIILAWGNQGIGLVIRRIVFEAGGLSLIGAIFVFLLAAGIAIAWDTQRTRVQQRASVVLPERQQRAAQVRVGLGVLFMLILPFFLRTYLTEVVNNIGLYVLMGFGLNIVVGFAGLLDLGYVAFFAIGAYTMGVLTSTGALGVAGLSFWAALPFCLLASVMAGVILGVPVLRMRGDYLAIVTLGFGEIIRILALSDWLKPYIGGAQGILLIPKPSILGFQLISPESLYYLILIGCVIAAYVSWRLRDSRLGRQWMAMREDEDVAEASGIPLVRTKLLAFATGAAFAGLSGAIFASKLSSVFPHSFNLLVSINVLCLIIVGGIGSLPGVVVGAIFLIGLPELLREFAEYRYLMYGALLIVMMLLRPEGLWPSAVHRRELHAGEPDNADFAAGEPALIEAES